MLEKQSQEASGGSLAIQASGSVTIHHHGLAIEQVQELVKVFLKSELPAFQEIARKTATENAQKLLDAFIAKAIVGQAISEKEFSKPSAQAAFQSALAGVALYAEEADIDMVAEALLRRLNDVDEPLLKRVLESVINVLPKLSASHISFLAFVDFVKKIHLNVPDLSGMEDIVGAIFGLFEKGSKLSSANIQYLASLGLININSVSDADVLFHVWEQNYKFEVNSSELDKLQTDNIKRVHEIYLNLSIPTVYPTMVGTAIGRMHLKKVFTGIDLADTIY